MNYFPNDKLDFFRIDVLHANLFELQISARGLPSPYFGEQRKNNLKAKVGNIVVGDKPIEIYPNGAKIAEVIVSRFS